MAVIFQDNFNSYADGQLTLNTEWLGDTQPVIQGIDYFSAPKSVKHPNAGGDFERLVYHPITAITAGYFAFYIKIGSSSQADGGVNLQQDAMNGLNILFYSDGNIYVNDSGGQKVLQTYEKNRWYRVVGQIKYEAEALFSRFKIDNGAWSAWEFASDSQSNVNRVYLYGHPVDGDIFFDDVVISTTEPLPTSEFTSQNWGMMSKSQIDDETIEEAINRLILEHETDPESHLDTGESLQSHKAELIIDHVAGSIVADKLSAGNNFFDFPVNSDESHNADNYTLLYPGAFAQMTQASPLTGDATDQIFDYYLPDWGYNDGDICVDVVLAAGGEAGTWLATFETGFAKIEIKANYYRCGYYTGSWVYSDWIVVDNTLAAKYRIRFDSVGGILYFLRNGAVIFSIAFSILFDDDDMIGKIRLNRGSAGDSYVFFGFLRVAFNSYYV